MGEVLVGDEVGNVEEMAFDRGAGLDDICDQEHISFLAHTIGVHDERSMKLGLGSVGS